MHTTPTLLPAAQALSTALSHHPKYALIGGAACSLLGSTRATQDIDIVVLRGTTATARSMLRASPEFCVDPRTNHTTYTGSTPVDIEILTPPFMFQEVFDERTDVVSVEGVNVLNPALLLNAKCGSVGCRSTEGKRRSDALDVLFLLRFCVAHPQFLPRRGEVPNATRELVCVLVEVYGGQEEWVRAGYDLENGLFSRLDD